MMHFKTRLLIGSSLVLSSRGWKCFPSVGTPRAHVCGWCQVCSALSSAWLGLPDLVCAWEQNKNTGLIESSWISSRFPTSVYLWPSLVAL